eukprot:12535337-Prorocentrum_lima.AAC.1
MSLSTRTPPSFQDLGFQTLLLDKEGEGGGRARRLAPVDAQGQVLGGRLILIVARKLTVDGRQTYLHKLPVT